MRNFDLNPFAPIRLLHIPILQIVRGDLFDSIDPVRTLGISRHSITLCSSRAKGEHALGASPFPSRAVSRPRGHTR